MGKPETYVQGGKPPGLRSADWKPLKTWHRLVSRHAVACGAHFMTGPAREIGQLPGGARICRQCTEGQMTTPAEGLCEPVLPADPMKAKVAVVTIGHHHSSMGCSEIYEYEGANWGWGVPLSRLFPRTRLSEGAKFKVTVEVLTRGKPCRNPFIRRSRHDDR